MQLTSDEQVTIYQYTLRKLTLEKNIPQGTIQQISSLFRTMCFDVEDRVKHGATYDWAFDRMWDEFGANFHK